MRSIVLSLAVCLASASAGADIGVQGPEDFPDKKRQPPEAQILDKIGANVPLDVKMTDHHGKSVTLGDYVGKEKPFVLVLGYYTCPMLCSLVLNGTINALKDVSLTPGEEFEVVALSIDAREDLEMAAKKQANYAKAWGAEGADEALTFHVAEQSEIKRLADAVGFGYVWDDELQQFAHGAGIFIVSPDGTLTHTLYGVSFRPGDVKFALIDSAKGEVGSVVDHIVMSCFQYYSDNHKYGFYIWGLVRLVGVVTLVFLGGLLIAMWRRERAKRGPLAV